MRDARSRNPTIGRLCLIAALPLLLAGCGEAPRQEQLSLARTHLAAAEASVGAAFAQEELALARQAMAETEAEYQNQAGFRLKRSPDEGHRLVEKTIALAEAASETGDAIWRQTSQEARTSLTRSETGMVTLNTALTRFVNCHKKAGIKGARKLVKETNEVKARYEAASQAFDASDFDKTVELTTGLRDEMRRVTNNLEQAVRGSSCSGESASIQ